MIVNADTATLNEQLTAQLSNIASSASSASIQDIGSSLQSVGASISSYQASNYPSVDSPCPQCSSNGHCEENPLYLTQQCVCDAGWVGDSCSMSSADAQNLEDITTKLLNQISTYSSSLRLTVDSPSLSYLQTILSMLQNPLVTTNIINKSLSIIQSIVKNDFTIKKESDKFDPVKMTLAAQIVDKCMKYVYSKDCYLQEASSKTIFSDSTTTLNQLGSLQLWQKPVDSGSYTLDADNFILYSNRVSASKLSSTVIEIQDQPKIVLGGSSSSSNNAPVDLQVVFWKTNLYSCPQTQQTNSTTPPLSIAINEKDTTEQSSAATSVSAQISYPITSSNSGGASNMQCATGCNGTIVTSSSGSKFFQCDCKSVGSMSPQNQLLSVFTSSNAYKLLLASALATYDYLSSWVFWLLLALASWYIITIFCIRAKIVSALRFLPNKEGAQAKQRLPQGLSRMRLTLSFWKAVGYGLMVSFYYKLVLTEK